MNHEKFDMIFEYVMAVVVAVMVIVVCWWIGNTPVRAYDVDTTAEITEAIQETTISVTEPEETIHIEKETTEATTGVTEPETTVETIAETTAETTTETVTDTTSPVETSPEATEPPMSVKALTDKPESDLELLACVIYQEAGGDSACDDCRRRVADVVLNRMAHSSFPCTLRGVLEQPYQYGMMWKTGVVWPERANSPYEAEAVERAYRIAGEVLSGHHSELFGKGYIYQAEFIQGQEYVYHCGHYFAR